MQFIEINREVLFSTEDITRLGTADIESLKSKAAANPRRQVRLCTHPNVDSIAHEMIIVQARGNYIRPHKHINKSESFHIIEGELTVVIFDESGSIQETIPMAPFRSGIFYYRLSAGYYHTIFVTSDTVVFHETTEGPFRPEDSVFAPWAPEEDDRERKRYMHDLDFIRRFIE